MRTSGRSLLVVFEKRVIVVVDAALLQSRSQIGAFLLSHLDLAALSVENLLHGNLCELRVELFFFLAVLKREEKFCDISRSLWTQRTFRSIQMGDDEF